MQAHAVTARHYAAIFMVALVTIATQILISRIFSVTFYYHFAFAGITVAMLGLTAGALRVYENPERFSAARAQDVLAEYGARFGLALALTVLLQAWLPGFAGEKAYIFLLTGLVALLYAFIASGVCIALLLTRFPTHTGRLYAADLTGAALGCMVILLLLQILDPIGALLALAAGLAIMGRWLLPQNAKRRLARFVTLSAIGLSLLGGAQIASYWADAPLLRLTWAKGHRIDKPPLFEHWNSYSRVAVTDFKRREPFGWGFGVQPKQRIEQKYLTIDADAATILTRFDGNADKVRFLLSDIINLGYHVRDIGSVAVIGVGGGRDILSGIAAGAKHIQGIELNPAIIHAVTQTFGDFTGHLDRRDDVSLAVGEARSYLNSHDERYDLIQISLIDTWAATAAGGLTLSENKLYTTEAWSDFLDRLNDDGMLVVSRWYAPESHQGELYRMLAIASAALRARDPAADPRQHLLVATARKSIHRQAIVTVIVSKSPLSRNDVARFDDACARLHFTPLLTPSRSASDTLALLADGADPATFDRFSLDVSASTDDRPFFFHMQRLIDVPEKDRIEVGSIGVSLNVSNGITLLLALFAFTFIAGAAFIAWPLVRLYKTHRVPLREAFPYIAYFAGIGLGFMLVEISQMQRLIIFLGHPVYSLSVVLFTLLLTSAVGSYLQRHVHAAMPALWRRGLLLVIVLAAIGLLMPAIGEQVKYFDTPGRILVSAAVIGVMGLLMGMMFPIGAALATAGHAHLLPWYWGINGAASVFASVLGVVLSLQLGIGATFWIGVACYGLCVAALVAIQRRDR